MSLDGVIASIASVIIGLVIFTTCSAYNKEKTKAHTKIDTNFKICKEYCVKRDTIVDEMKSKLIDGKCACINGDGLYIDE